MKTYKKALIITGIALIVLVPGIMFLNFLNWKGSPDEILAVANQFKPPASWELTSEQVRPPQTLCWDGGGCPLVNRVWQYDTPLSYDDLIVLLKKTSWTYSLEDDECKEMDKLPRDSTHPLCVVQITTNEYDGSLNIEPSPQVSSDFRLIFNLGPR